MTPLARLLVQRIAATGPIGLDTFMADCLLHPAHGYYATRDPLGAAGDFVTAPEISQMFGELLGLCLAQSWLDQGAPSPFALAELGPGRGTLMADVLRATAKVPGFHAGLRVHLVEASATLRGAQALRLTGATPIWHDRAETLPDLPLWLIANEFFDALPIRQFVRQGAGWAERQVGLSGDRLILGLAPPVPVAALAHRLDDTGDGDVVEACLAAAPVMQAVAQRIAARGGAAVIVDYGDWRSRGDTFQAVRAHRFDDPLARPGEADLTAHVDFEGLARAAQGVPGVAVSPMVAQGTLLGHLGIGLRAQALARTLDGMALENHHAATHRLTDPAEMGTLFKALAVVRAGAAMPPGFGE